jgi:hypothetical protein
VIPADCRVSRDDPGEAKLERQVGDCVDILVRQVGRDLYQQRNLATADRLQGAMHCSDQRTQFTDGLQVTQARRIG